MAITTLRVAGREKRVPYYHRELPKSWGIAEAEPEWLRKFETEIEALAETQRWIR